MENGKYMLEPVESSGKPTAYSDERFGIILTKARELKGLSSELDDMANNKFDELLGSFPTKPTTDDNTKQPTPQSWADKVLDEQDVSLRIIRNTLDRLARV